MGWNLCSSTDSASGFGEDLFDFVIYRKSANFPLREDHFAIDYDIKLASLARLHLNLLTKAGVERSGQTGRLWLVASNLAIQNLSCHIFRLARGAIGLNRYKQ